MKFQYIKPCFGTSERLHYICNISLKIVVFPEEMKNIRVTTLFKEGEVCGFGNFCLSFV